MPFMGTCGKHRVKRSVSIILYFGCRKTQYKTRPAPANYSMHDQWIYGKLCPHRRHPSDVELKQRKYTLFLFA